MKSKLTVWRPAPTPQPAGTVSAISTRLETLVRSIEKLAMVVPPNGAVAIGATWVTVDRGNPITSTISPPAIGVTIVNEWLEVSVK